MALPRPVDLVVGSPSLADTLAQVLAKATGRPVGIHGAIRDSLGSAVLVAATSECSPAECSGLAQERRDVVIIAAVPGAFQEQAYLDAGARGYFPMSIDLAPLVALLQGLL